MDRILVQGKRVFGSLFVACGTFARVRKPFLAALLVCLCLSGAAMADEHSFLPPETRTVSTVPANGDLNPYGVAFLPPGFPTTVVAPNTIQPGDVLVSNFNNSSNAQGTGSTIVDIPANGPVFQFFQYPNPSVVVGLTTALNVLQRGFVLVGNFPSPDKSGTCGTAGSGSIIVIDKSGNLVSEFTDPTNGTVQAPWDSALFDEGGEALYFVANALTAKIVRYELDVNAGGVTFENATVIASGYQHKCDAVTFVDAPTGLVYDSRKDVLYVASTLDNAVYAIDDAGERKHDGGIGRLVYQDPKHLHGALGLAMALNGHLLVTNNDAVQINFDPNQPSELVEFTVEGEFVDQIPIDPAPGGSFGLAVENLGKVSKLAAVDDNVNLFLIWTLESH
jgi:hypothetical protein